MVKEILNENVTPHRWEARFPATVKTLNVDSQQEGKNALGEATHFYRGTVSIKNTDGTHQTVQANCNLGAFNSNKEAFKVGAEVVFVIPTRTTGVNAGKGGWMGFAETPAFDFAKVDFEKSTAEAPSVAEVEKEGA